MKNQLSSKILKLSTLLMLIILTFSCKSYYKVDKETEPKADRLSELDNVGKYLIIHGANATYKINNFKIVDNKITGVTEILPEVHKAYILTDVNRKNLYTVKNKVILNEVHIYTSQRIYLDEDINVPLNTISKIEIYNKDKNATTKSWVFGSLGVGIGVYIILSVVLAIVFVGVVLSGA